MLKGIPKNNIDYSIKIVPFTTFASVPVNTLSLQDTSKTIRSKVQQQQNQIALPNVGVASERYTDSIFAKNELREKLIRGKDLKLKTVTKTIAVSSTDTSSVNITKQKGGLSEYKGTPNDNSENFLLNIAHKNINANFDTTLLPSAKTQQQVVSPVSVGTTHITIQKKTGIEGKVRKEATLDWLPIVLLTSLFIFSWIKLLYQKYVVQVVTSIVNYQVSVRLLRERNVLFRNMAIGLNLVFAINIGLFVFYMFQYKELPQIISENKFFCVLLYSAGVIIIYNLKTITCKVLGNIFMVREQFGEYVHNIHLYNKNIGLFLFPVVIVFPYITNDHVKPVVLYIGLTIVIGMSLLLVYRGFQIIMRNGVSIFYLILYLCAIEILPVLLLVKYLYTLI